PFGQPLLGSHLLRPARSCDLVRHRADSCRHWRVLRAVAGIGRARGAVRVGAGRNVRGLGNVVMFWTAVKNMLVGTSLLPSCYMWPNPFKIMEYEELLRGVSIRPTDVILDLGCGSAPQDFVLAKRAGRVV